MRAHLWPAAILILTTACALFAPRSKVKSGQPEQNIVVFSWNRPKNIIANPSMTQSATCRFKHAVVAYLANDWDKGDDKIEYTSAPEEEADTVSFSDLDTDSPKAVAQNGQMSLRKLFDDGDSVALVGTLALKNNSLEAYTLFRHSRIVIHSTSSLVLGRPGGTHEMGYCNGG